MRIGVFDSGIGGLTVLKQLVNNYSNNEYIYIGDTKNVPYGNKTKEELFHLSTKIIDYFMSIKVDKIIIACGTISSNIFISLKQKYSIEIIDIISPTIEFLNNSNYQNIGVIATNMTIESKVFSNNIKNKNVIEVATPKLVPLIESSNQYELGKCIKEYIKNFNNIDILILGCTHYPIIIDSIKKYLNKGIKVLDMSYPIIKNIKLKESNLQVKLLFTKLDENVIKNANNILKDINYNTYEIKLN